MEQIIVMLGLGLALGYGVYRIAELAAEWIIRKGEDQEDGPP